ncbi:MAG: DUF2804 domain-containing protein [Dehalococcoidia bacterium]|nr:MAG: DUF2804 domain-containing protein [Dehalococcoidia bacterium]
MDGLLETPNRAVVDGQVQFGRFAKPFRELNLLDARCGIPRISGLRRFRLKEWVHIALVHDNWYLSLAMVDAGFLVTSWLHLFDRRKGEAFEHVRKLPPGRFRAPANVLDHTGKIEASGYRVYVHNHLEQQVHLFQVEVSEKKSLPAVAGTLLLHEDPARTKPLVAMLPLGPNRPMFTHKSACPASGMLEIGGERVEFTTDSNVGLLDYHKAYYPRNTFWKWATFGTLDASGSLLGVNLTHNVIEDDSRYNENCIWHGNSVSLVGAARFKVPGDPMMPWKIQTEDGAVNLELEPQGLRRERVNLGLARSVYDQPYGLYSGTLVDSEGKRHTVERAFGVAEDHIAKW